MTKFLLLITGLFCFNFLSAQDTLKLTLDNYEPRVGDKVELSFSFNFFTDELKNQLADDVEMINSSSVFGNRSPKLIRVLKFSKPGKHTVGPFKFEFNGKKIVTDSIVVDVAEKLPYEEGVWVRLTTDNKGNKYLIVEQLIQNKSNFSKKKKTSSFTVGGDLGDGEEFAEVDKISEKGINFIFRSSRTNTRTKDDESLFGIGLSYSYKKYKIDFDDSFMGEFTLKKKHFKNLPRKKSFDSIIITR